MTLTAERLRELLTYDPETGEFRWRVAQSNVAAGCSAGGIHCKGYWQISVDDRRYLGHRLAWLYMTGEWPAEQIDHIDCDKRNNRWTNLRAATNQQNNWNKGPQRNCKSGIKGVHWRAKESKWVAYIKVGGKNRRLGNFLSKEDAAKAYAAAARELCGDFARAA